jgi:hypothetical protein
LDARGGPSDEDVHVESYELSRKAHEAIRLAIGRSIFHGGVAPFDVPQLTESLAKALAERFRVTEGEYADANGSSRRLRLGADRRGEETPWDHR